MKSFIVFGICLFLAGAFADSSSEEIKYEFTDKCREKHGVSETEFYSLLVGEYDRYSGEKYQCFTHCLLQDADFVKAYSLEELIAVDKVSEKNDKEKVQSVAGLCRDEKGDTDCETSFKRFKCFASKEFKEFVNVLVEIISRSLNKTDVK